jgi:hypothetical protein
MNKKIPLAPAAPREAEAARLARLPVQPYLNLADLHGAIKEGLMAFSCAAGLVVIAEMMEQELALVVGPKGKHDPDRVAERNGSAPGSVVLGSRTVPVRRPRAVRTDGSGEVGLDTYAVFSSADLLTQVALERMLAGVAATAWSPSRSARHWRRWPGAARSRRSPGGSRPPQKPGWPNCWPGTSPASTWPP